MPDTRGLRRAALLPCILLLLGALGCEEDPQIVSAGQPAAESGVQFQLGDYEVHYLELSDNGETVAYDDPVLVVELTVTNTGEDEFIYNPTHSTSELSKQRTPLLFADPAPGSEELDWETIAIEPITAVDLEAGTWEEQIRESVPLSPSDSITDYFLFELPEDEEGPMMLSIPPIMHRGDLPIYIRFDYARPEPQTPPIYSVGETIDFDGLQFTVTDVEQLWVEMEDEEEGEGFSDDALLKISYRLNNQSDGRIIYDPAHTDDSGRRGPVIESEYGEFSRVFTTADTQPVGQEQDTTGIDAGDSIEDFALFERPDVEDDAAVFLYSADHFARTGRVRVAFEYEKKDVEEPEELQEDD